MVSLQKLIKESNEREWVQKIIPNYKIVLFDEYSLLIHFLLYLHIARHYLKPESP